MHFTQFGPFKLVYADGRIRHCIGVESVKKAVIDTHQLAYAISVDIFKLIPIPVEPIRFQN